MRVIISGCRDYHNYNVLKDTVQESKFNITHILSGGVDKLGEQYARENLIPYTTYVADWKKYGLKAGILRTSRMANSAQALIAIWDGESIGTGYMIYQAKKSNLKIYIKYIDN